MKVLGFTATHEGRPALTVAVTSNHPRLSIIRHGELAASGHDVADGAAALRAWWSNARRQGYHLTGAGVLELEDPHASVDQVADAVAANHQPLDVDEAIEAWSEQLAESA